MINKIFMPPAVILSVIVCQSASAQQIKKSTPMAQATLEKSGSIYGGATVNGADVEFDGDLRLSMKGNAIIGGSLDACTTIDGYSSISDRFKIRLESKGNDLTGTGTTDYGRQPVSINLKKGGGAESITLSGQIAVGGVSIGLKAEGVDLQKVEQNTEDADETREAPQVPTFNIIQIKTPIVKIKDVLGTLRSEQVVLSSAGLIPSCADMRSGYVNIEATTNPSRVQGIITSLNNVGGIEAKRSSISEPNMSVKIEGAKSSARSDSDLVNIVSQTVGAVIGGVGSGAATMDPGTGEYGITVQRDSALSKKLGLKNSLTTKFIIGIDLKNQVTYINFLGTTARLVDDSNSKTLVISDDPGMSEEGGSQTGVNTTYLDNKIIRDVAAKVGGQTWDGENGTWK